MIGRDISHLMGFPFSLVDDLMENLKRQHYRGRAKVIGGGQRLRASSS
jgi:methanogenic corrinoid protein MtbC1